MCASPTAAPHAGSLFHSALFYRGPGQYLEGTAAFINRGLDAGERVLVATPTANMELLQRALAGAAQRVRFEDMNNVGRNPSRILSMIEDWADGAGGPARFVGEPAWPGR